MTTAQDAAPTPPGACTASSSSSSMTPLQAIEATIPIPPSTAVMARARGENFPVASLALPRAARRHLLAIYGFARLVDELGDEAQGDRLAALHWLQAELDAAYAGSASNPIMQRLSATMRGCALPCEPFLRLIEANRVDQAVSRYQTWRELEDYCALSANPVGELVLGVFGVATAERIELSDRICTALQLVEHCQDVAEDLRRGRIYMPIEDMRRCGCEERDLEASSASPPVRALIAFELGRVRCLLREGAPLVGMLHGRQRLAVAAFLAGGFAAAQAVENARFDVLAGAPSAGRRLRLRALASTLGRRPVLAQRRAG